MMQVKIYDSSPKNLKTEMGEEQEQQEFRSESSNVLNPRFSIQRREPICHEYFQVGKKCRGAECIVVLELNNNKHFKKISESSSAVVHIKMKTWKHHDMCCIGNNSVLSFLSLTVLEYCQKSHQRSQLHFNFEWTKWSILASFWKSESCGHTVLPDRSHLMI